MTNPIDLDLVELRCKLRGWTLVRAPAMCPRPDAWTVRDAHGITVASHGYTVEIPYPGTALLTAPRWTLERLLSEPPEGWRVWKRLQNHFHLEWGCHCVQGGEVWVDAEVWGSLHRLPDPPHLLWRPQVADASGPENLARLAERHKAAAELALILAEVEP